MFGAAAQGLRLAPQPMPLIEKAISQSKPKIKTQTENQN
jgi:hypothetical protein